jgi:hypothetical protein
MHLDLVQKNIGVQMLNVLEKESRRLSITSLEVATLKSLGKLIVFLILIAHYI